MEKYIVIGSPLRRGKLQDEIEKLLGCKPEIVAPTERKMLRPRRKSSKRKPLFVESPLFFEYAALEVNSLGGNLERLFDADFIWYVLMDGDKPKQITPWQLLGMRANDKEFSWEGKSVLFTSGPFKGLVGLYEAGKVWLDFMGKKTPVNVNAFSIEVAQK